MLSFSVWFSAALFRGAKGKSRKLVFRVQALEETHTWLKKGKFNRNHTRGFHTPATPAGNCFEETLHAFMMSLFICRELKTDAGNGSSLKFAGDIAKRLRWLISRTARRTRDPAVDAALFLRASLPSLRLSGVVISHSESLTIPHQIYRQTYLCVGLNTGISGPNVDSKMA